jgi:hypothetical protein
MTDDSPPTPPSGRYRTNFGPTDGPLLHRDTPGPLGVLVDDDLMPVGIAFPAGMVASRRGPATVFRLVVGQAEIEGRWLCVGREFLPLGDAAEEC